jgi:integrase
MGRPPKDIKHKLDQGTRRFMVSFAESPGSYHMTPETDLAKALAWGRRNRPRLLAAPAKQIFIRDIAPGFFDESGPWYQDQVKKGRSMTAASLQIRKGHIENYIIPLFGDYEIRELSGAEIDRLILDVVRYTGRDGSKTAAAQKALARGTRSKLLYSIKLMFDRWVYQGLVPSNPTATIAKYSKAPERPRGKLPREVLVKLFPRSHGALVRIWGTSMWGALFMVLFDTGARPGEARAMRWKAYYPEDRFLPIRSAVESGTAATIKGTKTNIIKPGYLQARTAQELSIWRAESRFNGDEDFIFTVSGAAPVTDTAIGKAFRRALDVIEENSPEWTPYWLRHSFVTYALEALDDSEVLQLAGHSNMMTNQVYRHPDDQIMLKRSKGIRDKLDLARENPKP